jgi:hypothetical protein
MLFVRIVIEFELSIALESGRRRVNGSPLVLETSAYGPCVFESRRPDQFSAESSSNWQDGPLLMGTMKVRILWTQPILCREVGKSGCSRFFRKEEIAGSNPAFPTNFVEPFGYPHKDPCWGLGQRRPLGAVPSGARGRGSQGSERTRTRRQRKQHAYHNDVATES